MNESFCAFRNELTRSGLLLQQHPKLRQSFQRLVEKSDALAAFSSGSDRCSSSKTPSDADPEGVETASPSFLLDGLGAVGSDDLTSAMGEMPNEFNALYASTTNNAPFGEEPLLQAPYHDAGIQMTASSSSPSLRFQNQNQNQYSLPQDLPLPSTYSFQESSFVRRLRRRCLEEGYCLLSDTRRDPGRIAHIFRFSLGFRNRETVRARYATALSRSDIENVDSGTRNGNNSDNYRQVAIPLNYHVGNAGTHFPPSRGTSPNSFPSISSTSENQMQPVSEFIGPWSFHFADPPHDKTSIEELLVSNDMAGEWFNATDVDGYLRQMGILIDGHSTFVTVPAKNVQSQPASHMQTDPFLDLSTATSTSANANANAMLQRAPFDLGTNMDVDLNLDVDLDLDLLTPLMTSQSASQPDYPFNMTQTTPLILDVEYFLDREYPPPKKEGKEERGNTLTLTRPPDQSRLSRRRVRIS